MYTKNSLLHVWDTGRADPEVNMSLDAQLLAELEPGGLPILHFYDWARASATYGHFIDLKKHLDLEKVKRYRLALAKRPTGGGVVFHIWDFAFSFLMPADHPACSKNTLENYQFVNGIVLETVAEHLALQPSLIPEPLPALGPQCNHFCMARPTIYDVVYEGKKVAGAAQRRTRQGYLHQGTISLAFPHFGLLKEVLLSQEEVTRAMETYTFAPLGSLSRPDELKRVRVELQRLLEQKFLAKLEAIPL